MVLIMCQTMDVWRPGWENFLNGWLVTRKGIKVGLSLPLDFLVLHRSRRLFLDKLRMSNLVIDNRTLMFYFARLLSKSSNTSI